MEVLLCSDKFKGSCTAQAVCEAVARGIHSRLPQVQIHLHPMADGGDGSLAVLRHFRQLTEHRVPAVDPLGRASEASYYTDQAATAYIELAAASGYERLSTAERDPLKTTTYGTGELLRAALARGCREVLLFLGGSSTNEVGLGIAAALGARFLDSAGQQVWPCGKTLHTITRTDLSAVDERIAKTRVLVFTDVRNPLTGPSGATHTFARQKGANEATIEYLEAGVNHVVNLLRDTTGQDVSTLPGAGAAGGVGAGLVALFGAQLLDGFAYLAEATGLEARIASADLVVTGEGKLDASTLGGKVVAGVAKLAAAYGVPVVAVVGANALTRDEQAELGLSGAHAVMDVARDEADAMRHVQAYLELLGRQLLQP